MNHVRPELTDPRVVALAKARQQLSHEGMLNPTYDELPADEQEGCRWAALPYLEAAIRAGLIPPAESPSDDHLGVWVDEEGFLYVDYPTSGAPGDDYVVRMVTANAEAVSRRDLEDTHGATFTRLGWCQ